MPLIGTRAAASVRPFGGYSQREEINIEYLLVAGGGGGANGGANVGGGGGGAGGALPGILTLLRGVVYPFVIGAGGPTATKGGDSTFAGKTAIGGGAGGNFGPGQDGGSGGGSVPGVPGGNGTPGQGNKGGAGSGTVGVNAIGAAGGGGAGGPGGDGFVYRETQTAGGPGITSTISGSSVTYSPGGLGGGMYGYSYGNAVNVGGGGNGGGGDGGTGSAGFRGELIVSYPNTYPAPKTITGTYTDLSASTPGKRTYRFTSNGSITF